MAHGERRTRDERILGFSGLVRSIARRYAGRGFPLDDLGQVGSPPGGLAGPRIRHGDRPPVDRRGHGLATGGSGGALRVYGDLTQSQIADRVGLSQMHVSRLLTHAKAFVRDELEAMGFD